MIVYYVFTGIYLIAKRLDKHNSYLRTVALIAIINLLTASFIMLYIFESIAIKKPDDTAALVVYLVLIGSLYFINDIYFYSKKFKRKFFKVLKQSSGKYEKKIILSTTAYFVFIVSFFLFFLKYPPK